MGNDFIKEMNSLGYVVEVESEENIKITKDGKEINLSFDKARRIFVNALISHMDNKWN